MAKEMANNLKQIIESKYGLGVFFKITDSSYVEDAQTPTDDAKALSNSKLDPKTISGKITLKVKSGPGVIIGETEKVIVDGSVEFTGIQFDTGGDYVVSVTSTSPDIESTEIKFKVLPEETNPSQEKRPEEDKKVEGNRPIIAQIDQPKIELKPMLLERAGETDTKNVSQSIGLLPLINYMGSIIKDRDITSLLLYHDGIIPKVDFTFSDTNNFMKSVGMPQDDTKFELFINPRSNNLKPIHLRFKIEDFTNLKGSKYRIIGTLDIPELYRIKFKTYNGTSFDVLREIAKELGLGFNSNINSSNDKMPWRNIGSRKYNFIQDIVAHSYVSEESYMAVYIDYYYCLNYVDVEKEMKRDISNDVGIDTGGFDDEKKSESEKISK